MRKILILVLLIIVVFRVVSSLNSPLEGKRIRLTGTLASEPKQYGSSLLISLHDYSFFAPFDPDILYNSKLVVEGTVVGKELLKIKLISVSPPTSALSKVRTKILNAIKNTLPEPESALLAGAALGAPNIPVSFNGSLRATGTSHIVVASGENLAILAGFLEGILGKTMKRKLFLPFIALILLLYAALTGFGAPIVRALIMWLIIMVAQLFGRATKPLSILISTILLMLLVKPVWATNVNFQLSVGATAGVILLTNPIQKRLTRLPIISQAFATSLAAQIGILPVSIFVFKQVQLLAPLWNVLVLWTVPYITVIGLLGSVATLLFEPFGKLIFLMSYPFSFYFIKIISIT